MGSSVVRFEDVELRVVRVGERARMLFAQDVAALLGVRNASRLAAGAKSWHKRTQARVSSAGGRLMVVTLISYGGLLELLDESTSRDKVRLARVRAWVEGELPELLAACESEYFSMQRE